MPLPQVGDESERAKRQSGWWCIPLPHQEDFAFCGLTVSDLMHTLGGFEGYCISKNLLENKCTFIEYVSSLSGRCLARYIAKWLGRGVFTSPLSTLMFSNHWTGIMSHKNYIFFYPLGNIKIRNQFFKQFIARMRRVTQIRRSTNFLTILLFMIKIMFRFCV